MLTMQAPRTIRYTGLMPSRASPLPQVWLKIGDEVLWKRPVGDQLIEVLRVEPEA
ncbi:hypothetical protein ALQ18_01133 [Pseudomonas marginalis pv. marginalis]|nr:hypothetical protein ALQ18_01133 [Pseudomonas marginalis pv. marginalis]